MSSNRKPTPDYLAALSQQDTLGLEEAASMLRLGIDSTRELIDSGELVATSENQKHVVLLRVDVIDYLHKRGRQQAEERRRRAIGKPVSAPKGAAKQPGAARTPAPDLKRYEVTTVARPGSTPEGSRSA